MTTVLDPKSGRYTPVKECRSCRKPVYWGYTKNGKACPYELTEEGEPMLRSHFETCPNARTWSKRK